MHRFPSHDLAIAASVASLLMIHALAARPAAAQSASSAATAAPPPLAGAMLTPEAACTALEDNLPPEPAFDALLELAQCLEQRGRLASAWARYREAADRAARDNDTRSKSARNLATSLQPRLPVLIIRVARPVPGLIVTRDGVPVDEALLGRMTYMDPGEHEIAAEAPGYMRIAITVTTRERKEEVVTIPALQPAPTMQMPAHAIPAQQPARSDRRTIRRHLGRITGVTGAAMVAVGLGFGWSARSSWHLANGTGKCNLNIRQCSPYGEHFAARARSHATISNVLTGTGLALVATGVVLYVTAPRDHKDWRAHRIVPMAGPSEAGLAVAGSF